MQTVHHTLRVADAVAFGQNTLHTHQHEAFGVCTQLDKQQHFFVGRDSGGVMRRATSVVGGFSTFLGTGFIYFAIATLLMSNSILSLSILQLLLPL